MAKKKTCRDCVFAARRAREWVGMKTVRCQTCARNLERLHVADRFVEKVPYSGKRWAEGSV